MVSKNRPTFYWSIDEGIEGYLMQQPEMFRVISPGLFGGGGSISFESTTRPGFYLTHRDGLIFVEQGDLDSEVFRRECSWIARKDMFFEGYTSFESAHRPGWFIRHKNRRLQVTQLFSQADRNDASFMMTDAFSGGSVETTTVEWRRFIGMNLLVG